MKFSREDQVTWARRELECSMEASDILTNAMAGTGANPLLVKNLAAMATMTRAIDALLYLTKERHRDHSDHQPHVAITGLRLMDCKLADGTLIGDRVTAIYNTKLNQMFGIADKLSLDEVRGFWVVASLMHDVGYPLGEWQKTRDLLSGSGEQVRPAAELIEEIVKLSGSLFSSDLIALLLASASSSGVKWADLASNLVSQFGDLGFDDEELVKQLPKLESRFGGGALNHGILSALNLTLGCADHLGALPPKHRFLLAEAAIAMAFHDATLGVVEGVHLGIAFDKNPYAALLRFCDEIHEWDRFAVTPGSVSEEVARVLVSPVYRIGRAIYLSADLKIRFELQESRVIEAAGWQYKYFARSKRTLGEVTLPFRYSMEIWSPISIYP